MDIIVSNMDSTPIYEQITRQIKAKILGGDVYKRQAVAHLVERHLAKVEVASSSLVSRSTWYHSQAVRLSLIHIWLADIS